MRKYVSLIAAVLLLMPSLALAADKAATSKPETKAFTLSDPAQVGSVQLAPGPAE